MSTTENKKVYPMAASPRAGVRVSLYYVAFPQRWKEKLLAIARMANPRFNDFYGLKTYALENLLNAWTPGVVRVGPLSQSSQDAHWLTSLEPWNPEKLSTLCEVIQTWAQGAYSARGNPRVAHDLNELIQSMRPEELAVEGPVETELVDNTGMVREEAYNALPLLAVNPLHGAKLRLHDSVELQLSYAARNELISQPLIFHTKQAEARYSYVFRFSVQTTPPDRKAALLCQISIRRWAEPRVNDDSVPFLKEAISAHIAVQDGKYCRIPVKVIRNRVSKEYTPVWTSDDKRCYELYYPSTFDSLPDPRALFSHYAAYRERILLPYKNGMDGRDFCKNPVGTGVSMRDKEICTQQIWAHLADIVEPCQPAVSQGQAAHFPRYEAAANFTSCQDFRSWFSHCTETNCVVFELYGDWNDSRQTVILTAVEDQLVQDLGSEDCGGLSVQILHKSSGDLVAPLSGNAPLDINRRAEKIGQTAQVCGAFVVLPGPEYYRENDPKQVLRAAFAKSGRVVQFLNYESSPENPAKDANHQKIMHAVLDLYRQLGVVSFLKCDPNTKTSKKLIRCSCIGLHAFTQIHSYKGLESRGAVLPIQVIFDLKDGRTRVRCALFDKPEVNYREACLEVAKLYWKENLAKRCVEAARAPAKELLHRLKILDPDQQKLLLVTADGKSRKLWNGISDKAISQYQLEAAYCPREILVGAGKTDSIAALSLSGSNVRIIRVRCNEEVPDYYTECKADGKYKSSSGLFQYGTVFWSIDAKPNDPRYTHSYTKSRVDEPKNSYAEKTVIELYPLQLQPGDDPKQWVNEVHALRELAVQYDQMTSLPLPLHLARQLEEYLME